MPALKKKDRIDWSKYDFSGLSKRERYKKKQEIKRKITSGYEETTKISKAKAKRLGVSEDQRRMTREQLEKIEQASGQYTKKGRSIANIEAREKEMAGEWGTALKKPEAREAVTAPLIDLTRPIQLGKGKTGIAAYREKKGFLPGVVRMMTSLKTTAILGGVLAALSGFGIATGALRAGTMGTTAVAKAGMVGRFPALGLRMGRYATNPKSAGLTKSFFLKVLKVAKNPTFVAGTLLTSLGSYPFALFIKEEAIQQTGMSYFQAAKDGDLEGMRMSLDAMKDIVNAEDNIIDAIPLANVAKKLKGYFAGTRTVIEVYERQMARLESGEPTAEDEKWAKIEEERKARDIEEMEWKAEYYALIREGRYEEAEELLQSMKGG